mgnify:CR=1 FL=1
MGLRRARCFTQNLYLSNPFPHALLSPDVFRGQPDREYSPTIVGPGTGAGGSHGGRGKARGEEVLVCVAGFHVHLNSHVRGRVAPTFIADAKLCARNKKLAVCHGVIAVNCQRESQH